MSKEKIIYRFPRYVKGGNGKKRRIHGFSKYKTGLETFQADTFKLSEEDLEKRGFFTKKKHRLCIHKATIHDEYNDLTRGPQTMSDKDLGVIAAHIPLTNEKVMLEIGVGSGKATCFLTGIAQHVDSYDISQKNIDLAKKNTSKLGRKNVSFHKTTAEDKQKYKEEKYDAALIDIPTPEESLNTVTKSLKVGGIAAFYTIHTTQAKNVINQAPENLRHQKTIRVNEEKWKIENNASRPKTTQIVHTGYISFYRKIAKC